MAATTVDPTDTLAVLKAAEELLKDPEHWARGHYWLDEDGYPVAERQDVVRCCATGALSYVTGSGDACAIPEVAYDALRVALGKSVPSVNDGKDGHPRIMAGLRKAIETLEAER